jgi:DNA-binding transcriptional LysR family regulator
MALELRQLRHLIALAEHGSLGRAAIALHMTQPALSRSLKQIEWEAGKVLFERSSTGVTPTDHGHLLLRRARELVRAAEAMDAELLMRRVSGSSQLNIGAGPYPGETVVPVAVARFTQSNPLTGVRLVGSGDWDDLLRRLRARELDLVVAEFSTFTDQHDLDLEPLQRHQGYFMARPGHPLAGKADLDPEQTFAYPFVAGSRLPPRALHPMLSARLPSVPRQPGRPFPAIECTSLAVAKQIVAASDAIGPFTLPLAADELERGRLIVLGSAPWIYAHYAIVSVKGHAAGEAATQFRHCLREEEAASVRLEAQLEKIYARRSVATPARAPTGQPEVR